MTGYLTFLVIQLAEILAVCFAGLVIWAFFKFLFNIKNLYVAWKQNRIKKKQEKTKKKLQKEQDRKVKQMNKKKKELSDYANKSDKWHQI